MFRLTLRLLGLDVLTLDLSTDDEAEELPHADQLSTDVGFVADKPERDSQADTYVRLPRLRP